MEQICESLLRDSIHLGEADLEPARLQLVGSGSELGRESTAVAAPRRVKLHEHDGEVPAGHRKVGGGQHQHALL